MKASVCFAVLLAASVSAFAPQSTPAAKSALFSSYLGPSGSSGPGSGTLYGYGRGGYGRGGYGRGNGYGRNGGYGTRYGNGGYGRGYYGGSRYGYGSGYDTGFTRTGVPVSTSGGITDGRLRRSGDTAFPTDYYGGRSNNYRRDGNRRYGRYNDRYGRWSAYENSMNLADNEVLVQGNSLKTWTYNSPEIDRVQVAVRTEGRPFDTEVDLWQGPDNTPQKMRVYSEDGAIRPFQVLVETPRAPNTVAIRNVGQMEFPMIAAVQADISNRMPMMDSELRTVQGGALRTYPFDPTVESVQVMITTDGRPLTARIELLQGPNNNKQVIEVYCEDGYDRPFYVIMETPGSGNVVRVVNTATVEFPMSVAVEAYQLGSGQAELEPVLGEGYGYNMNAVGQW